PAGAVPVELLGGPGRWRAGRLAAGCRDRAAHDPCHRAARPVRRPAGGAGAAARHPGQRSPPGGRRMSRSGMTSDTSGAGAPPDLDADRVREAMAYYDRWLAFQQRYQRVPGVQAAVRLRDEVLLDTAHGAADLAGPVPLTTRHLFRIASHSKTFTATVVMRLAEGGTPRLPDPPRPRGRRERAQE